MPIVLVLIGAFLIYEFESYLYRNYWRTRLGIQITFQKSHVLEGSTVNIDHIITNAKWLPLPTLNVKFYVSKYLVPSDMQNWEITDHAYYNELLSMHTYEQIRNTITLNCTRRGYYELNKIDFVGKDLFYMQTLVHHQDSPQSLYVFPRPVAYQDLQPTMQYILGNILSKKTLIDDPFELSGIREYAPTDSMKAINWKASARTGDLKVNVPANTSSIKVSIILNLELHANWIPIYMFEDAIRLASSIAGRLIEQGIPVSLLTNGHDILSDECVQVPGASGNNHTVKMNEALSRIDLDKSVSSTEELLSKSMTTDTHHYVIFISTYHRDDMQQELSKQKQQGMWFSWILPVCKDLEPTITPELKNSVIIWNHRE